jgi:Domain of unknown function (DUF4124)
MRALPLLLMLGISAGAWSATVYKWVDENGVTHYSDQPNPKAEKLQISGAQTYGAKDAAVAAPASTASTTRPPPPVVCAIDSPSAGQVFIDADSVSGHVTLNHVVGEDNQAILRVDGTDISALMAAGGAFTIPQLERGDHTLTLQVTNPQGEVVCTASAVAFSIRQRSVIPPTAPTAPAAPTAPGVNRHSSS